MSSTQTEYLKPEWKGPIEGWTVNYLVANAWRVQRTMEISDALQEAWIVFDRCRLRYTELRVDQPQHFFSLYRTAFVRHFTDLSVEDTARRVEGPMPVSRTDDGDHENEQCGELDNEGRLAVMLRQAPAEVASVINLFLNAPQELIDLAMNSISGRQQARKRHGAGRQVNRMLGVPDDRDLIQETRDYFS